MPSIAITDAFPPAVYDQLREAGWEAVDGTDWSVDELRSRIGEFEALLVRSRTKVTKELIESAPKLRVIARGGVGLDNIDRAAAEARKIEILNTPGASGIAVAELALLFMLTLARRLPDADRSTKEGRWEKKAFTGGELHGKTLGIIGFGNIGRLVARRSLAFGMKPVWFDPAPVDPGELSSSCRSVDFDHLLESSDYVTLHVPLVEGTHHLLGKTEFSKMKSGANLVHCARGGVVDEAALLQALDDGKLAGAALDVFEEEPIPTGSPLFEHPRVVLTPHIGAATRESQGRVGEEIVERIVNTWASIS